MLYISIDVWRRVKSAVIHYRCFRSEGTGRFVVQSADYYQSNLTPDEIAKRIAQLNSQFIELLAEEDPFEREKSHPSINEAIAAHDKDFGVSE